MSKLFALLVPTVRTDKHAYGILSYLASLAHEEFHVYMSDNSLDAYKSDFLISLANKNSNIYLTINNKNIGATANGFQLTTQTSDYEFTCLASDKNYVSEAWLQKSIKLMQSNLEVASACGHYFSIQSNGEMVSENVECTQDNALDRIKNYFEPGWNTNLLVYTPSRVKDGLNFLNFCKTHPLLALFIDHFQGYNLLAKGTFVRHKQGVCTWHSGGWDNVQNNWNSQVSYYKETSLPETFVALNWLYCAVDSIHFFLGKHSPHHTRQEAFDVASFLWNARRENFILRYQNNPDFYKQYVLSNSANAIGLFESLLFNTGNKAEDVIDQFASLLSYFNTETAEAYRWHVLASLRDAQFPNS